jgi:hypothetical protein
MNVLLRVSILCLCIYGADTHAGVQEDFPDFFPKEPDKGAEQNGWDLLPSLGKIPPEDREGLPEMFNFDPERLSRLNVKKTRALAERYAENLRILERIMDAPRLKSDQWRTFKINGDGGFDSMKAAITAQLLLCKTVADAREGNAAQGVATGLRVLRFGLKICEAEPLLADLAVSASLINMGAGTVAAMAALPDMDSTALRKAAKDLDACDTAGTVFRQGLKGEARWALSFCEPLLQEGDGRKDTVIELAIAHELMSAIFSEGAEKKKGGSVTEETLREKWKKELPAHVKAALRDADKVDWRAHTQAQAELVRALMKADNRSLPAFKASFHPPRFLRCRAKHRAGTLLPIEDRSEDRGVLYECGSRRLGAHPGGACHIAASRMAIGPPTAACVIRRTDSRILAVGACRSFRRQTSAL